jgi:hypothetical protein
MYEREESGASVADGASTMKRMRETSGQRNAPKVASSDAS